MMNLKKIFMLLAIAIFLQSSFVFAAEPQMVVEGEQEAKLSETKTLTVKISSETDIGIISGKIEKNDKISNISVYAKNNWNLTYNPETAMFNILKPEGAKTEEIMSIEYTTSNSEGIGKITLSNLELTTVEYDSFNINDITKEITIKKEEPVEVKLSSIKIVKEPTKTTYIEGENFDPTGMEVEAQYSDGTSKKIVNYTYTPNGGLEETDTKVIISYTEGGITKTVEQHIEVTPLKEEEPDEEPEQPDEEPEQPDEEPEQPDEGNEPSEDTSDAETENEYPYAGLSENLIIATILSLISGCICYIAYRKNKDI